MSLSPRKFRFDVFFAVQEQGYRVVAECKIGGAKLEMLVPPLDRPALEDQPDTHMASYVLGELERLAYVVLEQVAEDRDW